MAAFTSVQTVSFVFKMPRLIRTQNAPSGARDSVTRPRLCHVTDCYATPGFTPWLGVCFTSPNCKNKFFKNAHALACVSQLYSAHYSSVFPPSLYLCPSQVPFRLVAYELSSHTTEPTPETSWVAYYHTTVGLNPSKSERRYFYSDKTWQYSAHYGTTVTEIITKPGIRPRREERARLGDMIQALDWLWSAAFMDFMILTEIAICFSLVKPVWSESAGTRVAPFTLGQETVQFTANQYSAPV